MRKIILLKILLIFSTQSIPSEDVVLNYAYNFPLLICYNDDYRACYNDISVEKCALELKKYRDQCLLKAKDLESLDEIGNIAACMVTSHAGVESFEKIEDPCIKVKGMNINITKNTQKIKEANPEWVLKILE